MSSALNWSAPWVAVAVLVLLSGCDAYKEDLLGEDPSSGGGQGGSGGGGGGQSGTGGLGGDGGAATDGGGMCVIEAEQCNLLDDDCDGTVDEAMDTVKACEAIVVHAQTMCVFSRGMARCLKLACHAGFTDGNGRPEDGCETALDEGDGGADEDAGN